MNELGVGKFDKSDNFDLAVFSWQKPACCMATASRQMSGQPVKHQSASYLGYRRPTTNCYVSWHNCLDTVIYTSQYIGYNQAIL